MAVGLAWRCACAPAFFADRPLLCGAKTRTGPRPCQRTVIPVSLGKQGQQIPRLILVAAQHFARFRVIPPQAITAVPDGHQPVGLGTACCAHRARRPFGSAAKITICCDRRCRPVRTMYREPPVSPARTQRRPGADDVGRVEEFAAVGHLAVACCVQRRRRRGLRRAAMRSPQVKSAADAARVAAGRRTSRPAGARLTSACRDRRRRRRPARLADAGERHLGARHQPRRPRDPGFSLSSSM